MTKSKEYYFKEGCYIQEWHNTPQDEDQSIAHVRVEPRQTTQLHRLENTTERYVILDGTAQVTVAGETWVVSTGDVVVITPNQPQKIENLVGTDLKFLAICSPRFNEKNYFEVN